VQSLVKNERYEEATSFIEKFTHKIGASFICPLIETLIKTADKREGLFFAESLLNSYPFSSSSSILLSFSKAYLAKSETEKASEFLNFALETPPEFFQEEIVCQKHELLCLLGREEEAWALSQGVVAQLIECSSQKECKKLTNAFSKMVGHHVAMAIRPLQETDDPSCWEAAKKTLAQLLLLAETCCNHIPYGCEKGGYSSCSKLEQYKNYLQTTLNALRQGREALRQTAAGYHYWR
jgi:tetratricopeptide (TPR) repeat protein